MKYSYDVLPMAIKVIFYLKTIWKQLSYFNGGF